MNFGSLTQNFGSYQRLYTESKDKHLHWIVVSKDPAQHIQANNAFIYIHVCQLDTYAMKLAQISNNIKTVSQSILQKQQMVQIIINRTKGFYKY